MKNTHFFSGFLISILAAIAVFPGAAMTEPQADKMDIFAGHFSRDGNNGSPSKTTKNNIYIKLYPEGQWIAMLHVPYPYAMTVESTAIDKVFDEVKRLATTSAYLRGTFGQLDEPATAQVEKFGYIEDRLIFECNSLSPCSISLRDDYLDLIKPGIINEHIIKFNHVVNP